MIRYMKWCDVMWCDAVWCGVVWRGVAWRGVAWLGVTWHDISWHDMTSDLIWSDLISYHIISYHILSYHISYHIISYGAMRCDTIRHGTARHGTAWHGMAWHGMILPASWLQLSSSACRHYRACYFHNVLIIMPIILFLSFCFFVMICDQSILFHTTIIALDLAHLSTTYTRHPPLSLMSRYTETTWNLFV